MNSLLLCHPIGGVYYSRSMRFLFIVLLSFVVFGISIYLNSTFRTTQFFTWGNHKLRQGDNLLAVDHDSKNSNSYSTTNTSSSISITIDHTFLLNEDTIDATKLSRSNNEILFDSAHHSTVSPATSHTTSHTANNDSNDDAASENELSTKLSETSTKAPTATITTIKPTTITTIESTTIPLAKSDVSMLAHDIESILHIPEKSIIVLNLKSQRECLHPHLIGRMSGPMLVKLVWTTSDEDSNVIVGHYNNDNVYAPLLPGKYYLEIIATMYNQHTVHTPHINVTRMCMIDPSRHRLTKDGVYINVLPSSPSMVSDNESSATSIIGRWYDASPAGNNNSTYLPLYTRYQPQNCRGDKSTSPRCSKATDIERFTPYKFNFTNQIDIKKLLEGRQEKICFVGASHSRMLIRHSKALETILNDNDSSNSSSSKSLPIKWTGNAFGLNSSLGEILQFDFVEAKFASNLTNRKKIYEIRNKNCTKVIIGTGQWDAGWPGNDLTSFTEYEHTLKQVMVLMLRYLPPSMHVYYRSVHYNPIGDKAGHCPPKDWRSPNVIDIYNEITAIACKASGMTFIDTSDIMGIMWDRASDWCHFNDISSDMEMIYFLRTVLSTNKP